MKNPEKLSRLNAALETFRRGCPAVAQSHAQNATAFRVRNAIPMGEGVFGRVEGILVAAGKNPGHQDGKVLGFQIDRAAWEIEKDDASPLELYRLWRTDGEIEPIGWVGEVKIRAPLGDA